MKRWLLGVMALFACQRGPFIEVALQAPAGTAALDVIAALPEVAAPDARSSFRHCLPWTDKVRLRFPWQASGQRLHLVVGARDAQGRLLKFRSEVRDLPEDDGGQTLMLALDQQPHDLAAANDCTTMQVGALDPPAISSAGGDLSVIGWDFHPARLQIKIDAGDIVERVILPTQIILKLGPLPTAQGRGMAHLQLTGADGQRSELSLPIYAGHLKFSPVVVGLSGLPLLPIVAHLDQSPLPDVALLTDEMNGVSLLRDPGAGAALPVFYPLRGRPTTQAAADIDGDGDIDLAVGQTTVAEGERITIFANNGAAQFAALPDEVELPETPSALLLVPLAERERPALITAIMWLGSLDVYDNLAGGRFAATPRRHVLSNRPLSLASGDLDGDGRVDIVAGCQAGFAVLWNSDAGLREPVHHAANKDLAALMLVRLRCAAQEACPLDVVALSSASGQVVIYRNEGERRFVAQPAPPVDLRPFSPMGLVVADVDRNGWMDLVITGGEGGAVLLLRNQKGMLERVTLHPNVGRLIGKPTTADLDGDDRTDLVLPAQRGHEVLFLRNLSY